MNKLDEMGPELKAKLNEQAERLGIQLPCGTSEAFELVAALGYRLDRGKLKWLAESGRFSPPREKGKQVYRWTLDALVLCVVQLDRDGDWLPGKHPDRKTPSDIAHEWEHLERFSLAQLLHALADEADLRNLNAVAAELSRRLPEATPESVFLLWGLVKQTDNLDARRALMDGVLALLDDAGLLNAPKRGAK